MGVDEQKSYKLYQEQTMTPMVAALKPKLSKK
jgi:hypothetical protein